MASVFMKLIRHPASKDKPLQTTPTRLNVTCRLNSVFLAALEGNYFEHQTDSGEITDRKSENIIFVSNTDMSCCGIDEIDFQGLSKIWDEYAKTTHWKELVARYIKASCDRVDERIVITGIPVKVGPHSQYHMPFYKKLLETLKEFGFRELCKPYRNANSRNTIIVLAGQIPG
jgi:hypothetical protein